MADYVQNTFYSQQATALPGDIAFGSQDSGNFVSAIWAGDAAREALKPGKFVALYPLDASEAQAALTAAGIATSAARDEEVLVALDVPAASTGDDVSLGVAVRNQAGGALDWRGSDSGLPVEVGRMVTVLRVEEGSAIWAAGNVGFTATAGRQEVSVVSTGTPEQVGRLGTGGTAALQVDILKNVSAITDATKDKDPVLVRFVKAGAA